jgi:hypothetical protein
MESRASSPRQAQYIIRLNAKPTGHGGGKSARIEFHLLGPGSGAVNREIDVLRETASGMTI